MDREALEALKARPEVEAFKVWLARLALPLVVAQAKVQSKKHRVDPSGAVLDAEVEEVSDDQYRINAAQLGLIGLILTELETTDQLRRSLMGNVEPQ